MNKKNSLVISKQDITNSLAFYNITDKNYIENCYNCLDSILKDDRLITKFNDIHKIIFFSGLDRAQIKKLWQAHTLSDLFDQSCHPFITNLILLSGYNLHNENMKTFSLDKGQINLHIKRVADSLTKDIYEKNLDGIRISQMLWGAYFINIKIIEVGRLQYELCSYNPIDEHICEKCVRIHIPKGEKLDIQDVLYSLKNSKEYIRKYFNLDNTNYYCASWLLSNEVSQIVNKDSNIYKFYNLFDVTNGLDATKDILNFVFDSRDITEYTDLPEDTSLQVELKKMLIAKQKINLGIGKIKQIYL